MNSNKMEEHDLTIFEVDGNLHIQGNKSSLLELAYSILETITGNKQVSLQLNKKVLYIDNKE